jgi:elongation factor G
MAYETTDFRNVVILGHGGVGKTALTEAMLFNTGAIDRLGRIIDGNTSLDYDPEEVKRQVSINMAVAPIK